MIPSAHVSFESHDLHYFMDTTLGLMVGGGSSRRRRGFE